MKLLFCLKCYDIVKLKRETKKCDCGLTSGRYIDHINAEYSGPCMVLGIGNESFKEAIQSYRKTDKIGQEFKAFVITETASSVRRIDNDVKSR